MEHKMIVEIFGKEQCPFCDKAKGLAEREGHNYTYRQLGLDFEFPEFMEKFPTARTFPQIIIIKVENEGHPQWETKTEEKIGGYTEYELLCNEKT
jgi:glutaredoxin